MVLIERRIIFLSQSINEQAFRGVLSGVETLLNGKKGDINLWIQGSGRGCGGCLRWARHLYEAMLAFFGDPTNQKSLSSSKLNTAGMGLLTAPQLLVLSAGFSRGLSPFAKIFPGSDREIEMTRGNGNGDGVANHEITRNIFAESYMDIIRNRIKDDGRRAEFDRLVSVDEEITASQASQLGLACVDAA